MDNDKAMGPRPILAFCGAKQSGKNTLADFLRRSAWELFGFAPSQVVHFALADPIKNPALVACKRLFSSRSNERARLAGSRRAPDFRRLIGEEV